MGGLKIFNLPFNVTNLNHYSRSNIKNADDYLQTNCA